MRRVILLGLLAAGCASNQAQIDEWKRAGKTVREDGTAKIEATVTCTGGAGCIPDHQEAKAELVEAMLGAIAFAEGN